jgi:hypothetical protein
LLLVAFLSGLAVALGALSSEPHDLRALLDPDQGRVLAATGAVAAFLCLASRFRSLGAAHVGLIAALLGTAVIGAAKIDVQALLETPVEREGPPLLAPTVGALGTASLPRG